MKQRNRNARNGWLLVLPLILGCMVFYGIPFAMVIKHSFTRGAGNSYRFVGLQYFENIIHNHLFQLAFGNTLKFLLIGLPLILVVSYAIALMLKNQVRKHQMLKSVLLLPYIMPVVGTMLSVELMFAESGLMNQMLTALNLPVQDWLNSQNAFWVVMGLYLWKNTGYSVILLLSGLITIPEDQYQSAQIDGANAWQQFRYITAPQMWYSVFFAMVFSLINAFKSFREIFLIGGTRPDNSIYMLQHFINNCFESINYPKLAVASVLLLIVLSVVFTAGYRWVMKKEAYRE